MGLWGRVGYSPANDIAGIFFALMKVVLIFLLKANTVSLFSLSNVCFVQKQRIKRMVIKNWTKCSQDWLEVSKCVSGDFRSSKSQIFWWSMPLDPP